ncbi:hypothetical protein H5410_014681 [Solanum commersonii]|uniref:Uncharacterized protein n=1 Tax=Solanum commersonii TaxID=4109 RepID=A0A9J5ZRM3_SOLCO|nr:hypothetical protein H5410_014681 [Solanum commersonii]
MRSTWLHRHQPTVDIISGGLHASDAACAHRASNVGHQQEASAKAYMHHPWRVHIGWATSRRQRQAALAKA